MTARVMTHASAHILMLHVLYAIPTYYYICVLGGKKNNNNLTMRSKKNKKKNVQTIYYTSNVRYTSSSFRNRICLHKFTNEILQYYDTKK